MSTSDYIGPSWFSELKKTLLEFHQGPDPKRRVMVDLLQLTQIEEESDGTTILHLTGGGYAHVAESYEEVVTCVRKYGGSGG